MNEITRAQYDGTSLVVESAQCLLEFILLTALALNPSQSTKSEQRFFRDLLSTEEFNPSKIIVSSFLPLKLGLTALYICLFEISVAAASQLEKLS